VRVRVCVCVSNGLFLFLCVSTRQKRVWGWLDEAVKRITAACGAREIFLPIFEVIAVSRGHSYYNTRMRVFRFRGFRIPILNLADRTIAALPRLYLAIAAADFVIRFFFVISHSCDPHRLIRRLASSSASNRFTPLRSPASPANLQFVVICRYCSRPLSQIVNR